MRLCYIRVRAAGVPQLPRRFPIRQTRSPLSIFPTALHQTRRARDKPLPLPLPLSQLTSQQTTQSLQLLLRTNQNQPPGQLCCLLSPQPHLTSPSLTQSLHTLSSHQNGHFQEAEGTYTYTHLRGPFLDSTQVTLLSGWIHPCTNTFQIQREHKKAEAAGTRAPIKANGLPVKAPKEMVTVST